MRSSLLSLTAATMLIIAAAPLAFGQKGAGNDVGIARQTPRPKVETVAGTVVAVETQPCEHTIGRGQIGTHLLLKTDAGATLNVHLGWADAVAGTAKKLTKGKKVSATVFRTDDLSPGHYVAQTLTIDGQTASLRDDTLRPEWAGGGGRAGMQAGMGRGPGWGAGGPGRSRWSSGQNDTADQAKYHRLMADLIEAKAADKPDQDRIDRLTRQIEGLEAPQPGRGPGFGRGAGFGRGGPGRQAGQGGRGGPWGDPQFIGDRDMFHELLANHEAIERSVKKIRGGVETVTESDDPAIAATIQRHVASMHERIENGPPIHIRDPLFAAVFAESDKIEMQIENTEKGVRVRETSDDPYVARLIQAHAEVVDLFVANGFTEVPRNHAVPRRPADQ